MYKQSNIVVLIFLLLSFPGILFPQGRNSDTPGNIDNKVYVAERINSESPVIDGLLDDEAWQHVGWGDGFVQRQPYEGIAPSQQTAFKILYDDDTINIALRMNDTEPDKIEQRASRRDVDDGDWINISFDSYYDRSTAFSFTITSAGVKGDKLISNDGKTRDISWDPVWYAKTAQDESGWTAEMRIPFSQLRYAESNEQVWGLQVERRLYRKEERSFWQFFNRDAAGTVSNFGILRGIKDIKTSRRIEILPYSLNITESSLKEEGNPFATGKDNSLHTGFDAKVGITSDITLDLTVNPDFGQVEADPSEVNLTAFETFFLEKRPFFTEGKNILNYQIHKTISQNIQRIDVPQTSLRASQFGSKDNLFYSRRIGRAPQFILDEEELQYVDMPTQSKIATAVKLSGKTKNGMSIGILNAVTVREKADIFNSGLRAATAVEPLTNYFAGRVQKDYRRGDTQIGGMLTATNRDIKDEQLNFLNKAAYTGGIDLVHTWDNRNYFLTYMNVFSTIRGDQAAMIQAQTASSRYFQRPDAEHVGVDSSASSLSGHGGTFTIGKAGQGNIKYNFLTTWRSPGLELNDIGFLKVADYIGEVAALEYWSYNPSLIFRSFTLKFKQNKVWDFNGKSIATGDNVKSGVDLHFDSLLKNNGKYGWGFHRYQAGLTKDILRGGPYFLNPGIWHMHMNISSDTTKEVQLTFRVTWDIWDDEISYMKLYQWTTMLRPSSSFSFNINPSYTHKVIDLQYIDAINTGSGLRFVFGTLTQKTLGIVARTSYNITPEFTVEYYGQPFISNGRFDNFKKITDPRANRYSDRYRTFSDEEISFDAETGDFGEYAVNEGGEEYTFENPNFNFLQFRSNLVIRWEYNPGSTLFLVWSQGRTGSGSAGNFNFGRNTRDLFDIYPTNIFLLKLNHWFSY